MSFLSRLFKKKSNYRKDSERIPLKTRVFVCGQDEHGSNFEENAELVDVSRNGGCLTCGHDVNERALLRLQTSNGSTFLARVRSCQYNMVDDLRYIGFELAQPSTKWLELVCQSARVMAITP